MNNINGLSIIADNKYSSEKLLSVFYAALLFISGCLAFSETIQLGFAVLPAASGLAFIFASFLVLKNKKRLITALLSVFIISLLLLLMLPSANDGLRLIFNRIAEISEARNRYIYIRLPLNDTYADETTPVIIAETLLALPAAAFSSAAVRKEIKFPIAVCSIGIIAFSEAYLGITPPAFLNILLFFLLACICVRKSGSAELSAAAAAAVVCAVALTVTASVPGVDPGLENYSEQLRDRISETVSPYVNAVRQEEMSSPARKESRLNEEDAAFSTGAAPYEDLNAEIIYEEQISRPEIIDYRKIILMLLAIPLFVIVPFLPLYFIARGRRKALERRVLFDSDDPSEAIRAMFPHIYRCLLALGLQEANLSFASRGKDVEALLPGDYAREYESSVLLWEEAAYSGHTMDVKDKYAVRGLLDRTEKLLTERSDRKALFRLRYIDCLIAEGDGK